MQLAGIAAVTRHGITRWQADMVYLVADLIISVAHLLSAIFYTTFCSSSGQPTAPTSRGGRRSSLFSPNLSFIWTLDAGIKLDGHQQDDDRRQRGIFEKCRTRHGGRRRCVSDHGVHSLPLSFSRAALHTACWRAAFGFNSVAARLGLAAALEADRAHEGRRGPLLGTHSLCTPVTRA